MEHMHTLMFILICNRMNATLVCVDSHPGSAVEKSRA
jgi:hypothetical protein